MRMADHIIQGRHTTLNHANLPMIRTGVLEIKMDRHFIQGVQTSFKRHDKKEMFGFEVCRRICNMKTGKKTINKQ